MKTPRPRPSNTCLMLTGPLTKIVSVAEAAGCEAVWDKDAGTVKVTDDGAKVIAAIQKGDERQPWIVMFFETDRIKWSKL